MIVRREKGSPIAFIANTGTIQGVQKELVMVEHVIEQAPISAAEGEHVALSKVEQFIDHMTDQARPRLVRADGEAVEVPASVVRLLRVMVHHLVEGQTVTLVPVDKVLTTQQAAALLNVSRPYLVKLLDQGLIPHTMTGRHRRVRFADVLQYKAQRDARREEGLVQLAQLSQELGLYDS